MSRVTSGMDLAENIAALRGVEQSGRAVLVKPRVHRDQLAVGIKRQRKELSDLYEATKGEEYTDQSQDCHEERTRERVLRKLAQRAEKMGMKLVASENLT